MTEAGVSDCVRTGRMQGQTVRTLMVASPVRLLWYSMSLSTIPSLAVTVYRDLFSA